MSTLLFLDGYTKYDFITLAFIGVPLLLALFVSMRTNFLNGFISYLLLTYFTVYFITLEPLQDFFAKILPDMHALTVAMVNGSLLTFIIDLLSEIPKVGDIIAASYGKHVLLAFFVVLFLISQGISLLIRRMRRGY